MAIGDSVQLLLGTATTNRQPSAGVEEKITALLKDGSTDTIDVYDGTNTIRIWIAADSTYSDRQSSSLAGVGGGNLALLITNALYLRKQGSTDKIYVGGVQTNA